MVEVRHGKSIMNIPMIDRADNIDYIIAGADEEKVESAIKKLYD